VLMGRSILSIWPTAFRSADTICCLLY